MSEYTMGNRRPKPHEDALIYGLFRYLPDLGEPFPPEARERWLRALRVNMEVLWPIENEPAAPTQERGE